MKYFWAAVGWIWKQRLFFAVAFASALLFFVLVFPYTDLSDGITSAIAQATGNQVYVQMNTLDLNVVPVPSISATGVTFETATLPALQANWMKATPAWLNLLFNSWSIRKAASGDAEASRQLITRLGGDIAAEGIMGGDIELSVRPGAKSEQGVERSRMALSMDQVNLGDFQKWSDLPLKMQGKTSLETQVQFAPGFQEQPEGQLELTINKFTLPAQTLMIPMDENNSMPFNLPTITLDKVVLRGRLSAGSLIIEEGTFGDSSDPLSGRIKGQLAMRLQPTGAGVSPQFGTYNLTVELNTNETVEKEMGIAFLLFQQAKTPKGKGAYYLFRASGSGFYAPPAIARITSF